MKLRELLFWTLLCFAGLLNAQADFRPGYVIKAMGDTIKGTIDYRGDLSMGRLCRFKSDTGEIVEYTPAEIMAFRFLDSKYYVTREAGGEPVFLEYLVKGKIDVYYLRDKDGDHYYLDKEDLKLQEIPYEEGVKYKEGKRYSYKTKKHIGMLKVYMRDATGFEGEISKMKRPEHKNLIKLAEEYHYKVCDGEKCIIYEKKQPLVKVNFELLGGVTNFENMEDRSSGFADKNYFTSGVLIHFWLPRVNEKLFLKTGFITSRFEGVDGKDYNYFKVPLHIGYLAPKAYRVRPSLSIALLSPSYSAGAMVRISKRLNVGAQGWVHFRFEGVPWIPTGLDHYALFGNLYIDLSK